MEEASVPMASCENYGSRRVLLVEDHEDTREALAMLLTCLGHEVRAAATAAQAREILRAWPAQVLISDLGLPDMNGCELIRVVRRDHAGCLELALAVSGYGTRRDREASLAAGFDAHLTKPIDPEELDELIRGKSGACLAARGSP
jgi:CheY-like chemotaxis protein